MNETQLRERLKDTVDWNRKLFAEVAELKVKNNDLFIKLGKLVTYTEGLEKELQFWLKESESQHET